MTIYWALISLFSDLSNWDVSNVTSFQQTFYGTSAFNFDLCMWGTKITNTAATTGGMFTGSGCTISTAPSLEASPKGPFCAACPDTPSNNPSFSPSAIPSDQPSKLPSMNPSSFPSQAPSMSPSFVYFPTRAELYVAISAGDFVSSQYGPVETWDVSRVTSFAGR